MDLACESLLPDGYVWTEMKELDKNRKVNKKLFRCSYYMLCISSKPFILSMSYHCYTIRSLEVYGHYPFMEAPFTCKILGWIYVKGRGKPEGSGCQTHLQALHDKATIDSDHIYIKLYLSVKGGNQWWNGKTRSRLLLTIPPYSCPFLVPWDKNWGEIITREHVKHGGENEIKVGLGIMLALRYHSKSMEHLKCGQHAYFVEGKMSMTLSFGVKSRNFKCTKPIHVNITPNNS